MPLPEVDARLVAAFAVFRRPRGSQDVFPDDGTRMLGHSSFVLDVESSRLARPMGPAGAGCPYFLIPGDDAVALVNHAGVGVIDPVERALAGQSVTFGFGAELEGGVVGLLPDAATGAEFVFLDGTTAPVHLVNGVYVHDFDRDAASVPRVLRCTIDGEARRIDMPVPHGFLTERSRRARPHPLE